MTLSRYRLRYERPRVKRQEMFQRIGRVQAKVANRFKWIKNIKSRLNKIIWEE